MTTLAERYQDIQLKIKETPKPLKQEVSLLAVSKTRSSDEVKTLHQLGQKAFGENYIQEAVDKIEALKDLSIEWHFIGPLQSNKTRLAAEHFHWLHTIDRLKIAKRLNDQRPNDLPPLNVCLQVNIDNEDSKSGFDASEVSKAALEVTQLSNLCLRGLMAIPSSSNNEQQQIDTFSKMETLLQETKAHLKKHSIDTTKLDTLSMGMSGDMQNAIQCGATIVRIGTAIFGPRPAKTA